MTQFRYKGQVKTIQIIPWDEGLGIAVEFEDGNKAMQQVDISGNCFLLPKNQRLSEENENLRHHFNFHKEVSAIAVGENKRLSAEVRRLRKTLKNVLEHAIDEYYEQHDKDNVLAEAWQALAGEGD